MQESAGTSKTLMNLNYFENINDINGVKTAFQALDGGSIPLTRSMFSTILRPARRNWARFLARFGTSRRAFWRVWVAKYWSSGDRSLKQTTAMLPPPGHARQEQLRTRRRIARASCHRASGGRDTSCNSPRIRSACAPGPRRSRKIPDQGTRAGSLRSAVRRTNARPERTSRLDLLDLQPRSCRAAIIFSCSSASNRKAVRRRASRPGRSSMAANWWRRTEKRGVARQLGRIASRWTSDGSDRPRSHPGSLQGLRVRRAVGMSRQVKWPSPGPFSGAIWRQTG
jgi:hypothetical protein